MRTRLFAVSLLFSTAMAITGCAKEEGVMEKAGKSIDEAAESAGAAFVKTSTGFAPTGATLEDLQLMVDSVSRDVLVKAAGGIRTLDGLLEVMSIGVRRIGATRTESMLEDYKARASA